MDHFEQMGAYMCDMSSAPPPKANNNGGGVSGGEAGVEGQSHKRAKSLRRFEKLWCKTKRNGKKREREREGESF